MLSQADTAAEAASCNPASIQHRICQWVERVSKDGEVFIKLLQDQARVKILSKGGEMCYHAREKIGIGFFLLSQFIFTFAYYEVAGSPNHCH